MSASMPASRLRPVRRTEIWRNLSMRSRNGEMGSEGVYHTASIGDLDENVDGIADEKEKHPEAA